jgi:hypothetical protein
MRDYMHCLGSHGAPFTTVGLYAASKEYKLTIFVVDKDSETVSEIIGNDSTPVFLVYTADHPESVIGHYDLLQNVVIVGS